MNKSIILTAICLFFIFNSCIKKTCISHEDYDKLSLIIVEKDMEIDSLKQIINLFIEKEDSKQINK